MNPWHGPAVVTVSRQATAALPSRGGAVTTGTVGARARGIEDRLPPVVIRNKANAGGRL
jgi:hypothetical protein